MNYNIKHFLIIFIDYIYKTTRKSRSKKHRFSTKRESKKFPLPTELVQSYISPYIGSHNIRQLTRAYSNLPYTVRDKIELHNFKPACDTLAIHSEIYKNVVYKLVNNNIVLYAYKHKHNYQDFDTPYIGSIPIKIIIIIPNKIYRIDYYNFTINRPTYIHIYYNNPKHYTIAMVGLDEGFKHFLYSLNANVWNHVR